MGQVTFAADGPRFHLDFGRFGAGGLVHADESSYCDLLPQQIDYKLVGNDLIFISWLGNSQYDGSPRLHSATATISVTNTDTLRMVGSGGCGGLYGSDRISILTRVPSPN